MSEKKSERQWTEESCPCREICETLQVTIGRLDRQLRHHAIEEQRQRQLRIEEGLLGGEEPSRRMIVGKMKKKKVVGV